MKTWKELLVKKLQGKSKFFKETKVYCTYLHFELSIQRLEMIETIVCQSIFNFYLFTFFFENYFFNIFDAVLLRSFSFETELRDDV